MGCTCRKCFWVVALATQRERERERERERDRERERELHSLIKVQEVRAAFRAAYAPGSLTSWHFITADERIKAARSIRTLRGARQTDRHCAGNSNFRL